MGRVAQLRRAVIANPFTAVETALAVFVVGPALALSVALTAVPHSRLTWIAVPVASLVVGGAALVLPTISLVHGCYDGWQFVRADGRLPETPATVARALWRWLETLTALAFVAVGVLAVWAVTLPRETGGTAPLPGWSGVVLMGPLAVAGVLAVLVLLRSTVTITVTVGRRLGLGLP